MRDTGEMTLHYGWVHNHRWYDPTLALAILFLQYIFRYNYDLSFRTRACNTFYNLQAVVDSI